MPSPCPRGSSSSGSWRRRGTRRARGSEPLGTSTARRASGSLCFQLLRNLPHMTVGVREGGRAHSPTAVHGTVHELHAPLGERGACRIRVVDPDRELKARSIGAFGDRRRIDQLARCGNRQQVDDRVLELEPGGVLIVVGGGQSEDALVERLRTPRVLNEQGERADALQRDGGLFTESGTHADSFLWLSLPETPWTARTHRRSAFRRRFESAKRRAPPASLLGLWNEHELSLRRGGFQ